MEESPYKSPRQLFGRILIGMGVLWILGVLVATAGADADVVAESGFLAHMGVCCGSLIGLALIGCGILVISR